MKSLKTLVLAAPLALGLSGCVISVNDGRSDFSSGDWEKTQEENRRIINNLEMGTAQHEIMERLGEPDFLEAFQKDEARYTILFYRTHHVKSDGKTTHDETTPLLFKDGTLIGWGQKVLESIQPS